MHHHTLLGFCGWDLPAAIILIAVIVIFIIRDRKLKHKVNELEDQLDELKEGPDADVSEGNQ
ncbi:MAG: hypothetical protein PUB09_07740 [Firmicutes bacterium]|nr:hypothetical protein [Bacillota bacterium]